MQRHYFCLRFFTLPFMLFGLMIASARPLPICSFDALIHLSKPSGIHTVIVPLGIHTALDTSQILIGRRQFFRVEEDVINGDDVLFGAGAVAVGSIQKIERDEHGQIAAIGIEMGRVQATNGEMVEMEKEIVWMHIRLSGMRVILYREWNALTPTTINGSNQF